MKSLLEHLATEQLNPASAEIDLLPLEQALAIMNAEDQKVAPAVALEIPRIARAVDAIVTAFRQGGRLFYIGAGTSGRLGVLDASECPPTFDAPPDMVQGIIAGGEAAFSRATEASEDSPEAGASDLQARGFTGRDVLVGLTASGRTPYVLGAVRYARSLAAVTIGVTCNPEAEISRLVDHPIAPVVGPEIVAGSTRLKSGSAQKLVLNMLSTGAMIRLGCVYRNLMVNVHPKNEKLRDRARRIVAQATGCDAARAAQALSEANNDVRTAIVMLRLRVDLPHARGLLNATGNRISAALELGASGTTA
jgi:N-acetylmuramic acid 6-phosphate etherase